MAEVVVSVVINKLREFASAEVGSIVEGQLQIQNDLRFISYELSSMEALLRDAEQRSVREDTVREWVAQVRSKANEVDEVLEEFAVKMHEISNSKREANVCCLDLQFCISHLCFLLKKIFLCHQFHSKILNIKRELNESSERKNRYNLEVIGTSSLHHDAASSPSVDESDTMGTSHNYVPSPLKCCFLYCGMFPEGSRIQTSKLIRILVAEGIVENQTGKTLEEVASDYLSELVDRGFLQVDYESVKSVGVKGCRVHDLKRNTVIEMLKKEEFGEILNNLSGDIVFKGQRRVAIHSDEVSVQKNMAYNLNTCSFLTFSELPCETLFPLLFNCKQLRVLELSGNKFLEYLPKELGDLVHLRYFSIRGTSVSNLPISLENLYNLQTLDIRNTLITSFPFGMLQGKFPKLRHLLLGNRKDDVYLSLQNLVTGSSNLQTLSGVLADEFLIRQLEFLTGIRKLDLQIVEGQNYMELCYYIKKMQNLRSLRIQDRYLDLDNMSPPPRYLEKLVLTGVMKELPPWIGFLNCLQSIRLFISQLKDDPMSTFSRLPSLEVLHLGGTYTGNKMSLGGLFPRLKVLYIHDMLELEEFCEVKEGMMQNLKRLTMGWCPKFGKLPQGFQHLKALWRLTFVCMNEEFIKRLHPCPDQVEGDENKGGEDHWLIKHIDSVAFEGEDREIQFIPTVLTQ